MAWKLNFGRKPDKNGTEYDDEYARHTEGKTGEYVVSHSKGKYNLLMRFASILFAFMLWFYVMGTESQTYETTFTTVINIIETDAKLSVYYGYNNTVDITLQGKRSEISKINPANIEAYVDVSSIKTAGKHVLGVKIKIPGNPKIIDQSVSTISVYLDNKSTRSVPVKPKLMDYVIEDGELATDHISTDITEVVVTGPQKVLDTIESAQVSVSLGHVKKTVTVSAPVVLVDDSGEPISNPYVKLHTQSAVVTVPVYFQKRLPLEVEYKYGYYTQDTASVTVNPAYITVKGEAEVLDSLSRILLMTLDEKKIATDTVTLSIPLPAGVSNVSGSDEAVVTIKHKNTSTKEVVCSNISVNNPNNFDYELLSDSINVTLRGSVPYINYIGTKNISALVDLSHVSSAEGIMSVPVSFVIEDSYTKYVYEVGDYKMSVNIK